MAPANSITKVYSHFRFILSRLLLNNYAGVKGVYFVLTKKDGLTVVFFL